jgi:surfactin synthase thioesterase subunit
MKKAWRDLLKVLNKEVTMLKKIKLFCLPYAGGSSNIYSRWGKCLNQSIKIHPIELAGRGKRYADRLYDNIEQAFDDVYKIVEENIDDSSLDYAIFGHSLGGLIAYELIHRIKLEAKRQPIHVFLSGAKAPHFNKDNDKTYDLPDDKFKQRVLELGGTPREVLENDELLDVFLPILRADFKVNETYEYVERQAKIDCDITVLSGKKDDMKLNEIVEWRKYTAGKCNIFMLEGDHFFINTNSDDVIKIVNNTLSGE